jgi:mRNA-degrading endonuclease toxin of MazEF toxin-antitoxin module
VKPKRGEIWGVVLDPVEGSEMGGHSEGEPRPVVVLSMPQTGRPTNRVCVPLTSYQDTHALLRWCVIIAPGAGNGLARPSTAETSQIRALDLGRFRQKRGSIGETELGAIFVALGAALGFDVAAPETGNEPHAKNA